MTTDMNRCTLPPLDDHEDRGFWMTPFWHIERIEPLRVVAICGMGEPVEQAFLLIQSQDGTEDLSAYSISENKQELIWGSPTSKDEAIKRFISREWESLQGHWDGKIDSGKLSVYVGERTMKHHHGLWTWKLWGRKSLEIQHIKEEDKGRRNIGISIGLNSRADHAGLYCHIFLWNHELAINLYDGRHWCSDHGCWYDEEKHPYHDN